MKDSGNKMQVSTERYGVKEIFFPEDGGYYGFICVNRIINREEKLMI